MTNLVNIQKKAAAVILTLSIPFASANGAGFGNAPQKTLLSPARQFVGDESSEPGLIRISVLGGTQVPGKYFVPTNTDLFDLISLAGGLTPNADITNLTIRRRNSLPEKTFKIDGELLLNRKDGEPFYFADNDVLLVNQKTQLISPETMSLVSFTASVLSVTATLFLLKDRIK